MKRYNQRYDHNQVTEIVERPVEIIIELPTTTTLVVDKPKDK